MQTGKGYAAQAKEAPTAADAVALFDRGEAEACGVLERAAPLILQMMDIQRALRKVPVIDLDVPTVVLVGAPNVGKSSLIRAVSSGTPEVNDYPFTTRGVTLGHMVDHRPASVVGRVARFQIMDTPGVLARPDGERNEMESLTIASLQHLPTAVVFVADLSGLSGDDKSSVDDQCAVRKELRTRFPRRPWLDVVSKADLAPDASALEKFVDAVKETEGPAAAAAVAAAAVSGAQDGEAEVPFSAAGLAADVLSVSAISGVGLGDAEARIYSMLHQVDTVLRAYEKQRAAATAAAAAPPSKDAATLSAPQVPTRKPRPTDRAKGRI